MNLSEGAERVLTGAQLAGELGLSRARISQYVSEGKLAGCYSGEGRARRFDPAAVAKALGRRLDVAQMLGNGAETRRALAAMREEATEPAGPTPRSRQQGSDTRLVPTDLDTLQLVNTQLKEEQLRDARRKNAVAEKTYLLAGEVERQISKLMEQEIAEIETMLLDGAQRLADKLGVDFRTAKAILTDVWREHRAKRTVALEDRGAVAQPSDAEKGADI